MAAANTADFMHQNEYTSCSALGPSRSSAVLWRAGVYTFPTNLVAAKLKLGFAVVGLYYIHTHSPFMSPNVSLHLKAYSHKAITLKMAT